MDEFSLIFHPVEKLKIIREDEEGYFWADVRRNRVRQKPEGGFMLLVQLQAGASPYLFAKNTRRNSFFDH